MSARLLLVLFAFGMLGGDVYGCTVCMGATGQTAEAANGAIFVMLGVLGVVFSLLIAAGVSFARRARMPLPPELELTQSLGGFNPE